MVDETEKYVFTCLIHVNLNSHIWLEATMLNSTALKLARAEEKLLFYILGLLCRRQV